MRVVMREQLLHVEQLSTTTQKGQNTGSTYSLLHFSTVPSPSFLTPKGGDEGCSIGRFTTPHLVPILSTASNFLTSDNGEVNIPHDAKVTKER